MKKLVAVTVAAVALLSLTACGGNSENEVETSQTAQTTLTDTTATNVQKVKVPGSSNDILVFDIERDGQTLTCTTKHSYNSGVGCIKK
jgi:predicted outer membrane protein